MAPRVRYDVRGKKGLNPEHAMANVTSRTTEEGSSTQ